jgi:hypothetical protein
MADDDKPDPGRFGFAPDEDADDAPLMPAAEPNRWDCPGIVMIGDEVIWDGEAEYLGVEPKTTIRSRRCR